MLLRLFQTVKEFLRRLFFRTPNSNATSSSYLTNAWRERLQCNGRPTLQPTDFRPSDLLYRGFRADELDDEGAIDVDTLRFPDLSCNWNRFSIPQDVRVRMPSCEDDGCYSITVEVARYESFATPVHDPICEGESQNYSHVEIRELAGGETIESVWRVNFINKLTRHFEPSQKAHDS